MAPKPINLISSILCPVTDVRRKKKIVKNWFGANKNNDGIDSLRKEKKISFRKFIQISIPIFTLSFMACYFSVALYFFCSV